MSPQAQAATSSARWIRPPLSYTTVVRPHAAPVPEASSPPPSIPEPQPGVTVDRQPGRPIIRLYGEPFSVERDGDAYYIVHDRWSLMGSGDTLSEAYKDLLHMAAVLTPIYARTPPSKLDEEGTRLTRFLLHSR